MGLKDIFRRQGLSEGAAMAMAALDTIASRGWISEPDLRALPEVQAILDSVEGTRKQCVLALVTDPQFRDEEGQLMARRSFVRKSLLSVIGRKRIPLSSLEIESLFAERLTSMPLRDRWAQSEAYKILTNHVEAAFPSFDDDTKARLRPLLERVAAEDVDAPTATKLRKLLGEGDAASPALIHDGDDVGHRLRAALAASNETERARSAVLMMLASYPASGKPSKKWLSEAEQVRAELRSAGPFVASLLDAALEAGDSEGAHTPDIFTHTVTRFVSAGNESILCGVTALAGLTPDPELLPRLRRLAVKCVTVIGGQFGNPRSLRVANGAAQAIADVGTPSSITELLALERSVRHGTLLKQIRKAIDSLASAQGLTRDELLERAVEDHGLSPDGTRSFSVSRGTVVVEADARSATATYRDETDKPKKSIPADVRESDAAVLSEARELVKAVRKTIAGERHRLDGLMTQDRRWSYDEWCHLYLDHPITGRLARSLIWGFARNDGYDVIGIPTDHRSVIDSAGTEIAIPDNSEVRLWHPVHAPADEVRAWRAQLLRELIVQPIKQAFREIYLLTPAEEQTRVYSNRFAGHVFRQVQARALIKGRGWQPVAVAWWDDGIDHGVARRRYEQFDIRVEFFFDPILDIHPDATDLYPYCTSDQVRFFAGVQDGPVDLADVPLLVFTEAMRDVDLFVGVTSIGADPEWLDRGEGRRFETYWNAYSFGELTATAQIRKEILEQLVPRLAIADRCTLEDRYLTVRGDLRTYRIHLGSGNILMSPNDQYLCIVATRDARAEKLFLPFDDDPILSLILSKAFLLAADTAITDATITRQIKNG